MEYTIPEGVTHPIRHKRTILFAVVGAVVVIGFVIWVYLHYVPPTVPPPGPTEAEKKTELRQAQQKLLIAPEKAGMTKEDYAAEVAALAIEVDTITVMAGCTMDPMIIKMKEGSVLKLNNQDVSEHTLAFEDQNFFGIAPGLTREINITQVFGKNEGIYRYRCGDLSQDQNVGIMYIVK